MVHWAPIESEANPDDLDKIVYISIIYYVIMLLIAAEPPQLKPSHWHSSGPREKASLEYHLGRFPSTQAAPLLPWQRIWRTEGMAGLQCI